MLGLWTVERDRDGCFRGDAAELRGRLSGLLQTECPQNRMGPGVRGVRDFR